MSRLCSAAIRSWPSRSRAASPPASMPNPCVRKSLERSSIRWPRPGISRNAVSVPGVSAISAGPPASPSRTRASAACESARCRWSRFARNAASAVSESSSEVSIRTTAARASYALSTVSSVTRNLVSAQ